MDTPTLCPECGRPFSPNDDSTFDNPRRSRRRRRRIRRIVTVTLGLALVASVFPQGLVRASLTFTCVRCRERTTLTRWQLLAPKWIAVSYPGWHRNSRDSDATDSPSIEPVCFSCTEHEYSILFSDRWWYSRFVTTSVVPNIRHVAGPVGEKLTPENANRGLRDAIAMHLADRVYHPQPIRKVILD